MSAPGDSSGRSSRVVAGIEVAAMRGAAALTSWGTQTQ